MGSGFAGLHLRGVFLGEWCVTQELATLGGAVPPGWQGPQMPKHQSRE